MPLFDVVGRALKDEPEQIDATCVNVGVTIGLTVIATLFEVAGEPVKQGVAFDVITHVTASVLANVVEVNVAEFVPEFVPLIFHWYEGAVPPFVGVAVNVTVVPAQMVVAVAAMETLAVKTGFTTMVTPFDVAGEPVRHGVAFDVITQVITSPFANKVEEYVEAVAPEIVVPFFFQT